MPLRKFDDPLAPVERKRCAGWILEVVFDQVRHEPKCIGKLSFEERQHLRVGIEDDGKGFDPARSRGMGLTGMNERVSQLGGVLRVDSNPSQGTRLEVELPLPEALITAGRSGS